jgi:CheY-like chemotaxis protein
MAKILVVDDDKLIREGVVDILRSEDKYEISSAEDGSEGLKTALSEKPDLILSDVRMPKMTGVEMAIELRKDDWGKKVPIIFMTNDDMTSTINEALAAGVTIYLPKMSIDPNSLIQQVNALLGTAPS